MGYTLTMHPGGGYGFKVCPTCRQQNPLEAGVCPRCSHKFRQTFVQPGTPIQGQGAQGNAPPLIGQPTQPSQPTQAFYGFQQMQLGTMMQEDPAELARRFSDSKRLAIWTFWIGLFCLWPLWILTYLEYQKMQAAKDQIARQGGNVMAWMQTFGLRDLI